MDYQYHKLSDHSLKVLLGRHEALRYEAQLELWEELQMRSISAEELSPLKLELERKKHFLKSLGFLKEIGYEFSTTDNITTIKRRLWPQIVDVASIVVGVLLVFVGVYGVLNLYYLFTGDDGAGLQALIVNVLFLFMGYKGFQMLGGLSRFVNHFGMTFSFSEENIILKKRLEFKLEEVTGLPSEVHLEEQEELLLLKLRDEIILTGNPKSFVQRSTLESLLGSIQNGEVPQQYQQENYVS